MLKTKPTIKKPQSMPKKISRSEKQNLQNTKPVSFNTKGYFSPDQPFNEQYLKVKMQVYKKYRDPSQQLVVIDPKSIHRGAFIQRGLPLQNNLISTNKLMQNEGSLLVPLGPKNMNQERVFNSFVKNYINRKEKKERIDEKKYSQSANGQLSQIRALEPTVRDFNSCCKSSRASKSIMTSRQSTARSIYSFQDLEMP